MTKTRFMACLILVCMTAAGCSTSRSWSYKPQPRKTRAPIVDATLVVLPFEDEREETFSNYTLLAMIPLVPFGSAEIPRIPAELIPDSIPLEYSLALSQEIDNARLYKETFLGSDARNADYVLSGSIISTHIRLRLWTWGLSFIGIMLDFLGAPMMSVREEVVLRVQIADSATGDVLWTHDLENSDSRWAWIYTGTGGLHFDELLKLEYVRLVDMLEDDLRSQK